MITPPVTAELVGPSWPMPIADLRQLVADVDGHLTLLDDAGEPFDLVSLAPFTEVHVQIAGQPVAIVRPLPDATVQVREEKAS